MTNKKKITGKECFLPTLNKLKKRMDISIFLNPTMINLIRKRHKCRRHSEMVAVRWKGTERERWLAKHMTPSEKPIKLTDTEMSKLFKLAIGKN